VPEHVVQGNDGDAYAVTVKDGFLTWRGRDAADGVRLWPMSKDVEAPRAVRAAPGGAWLVVFRRDAEIWMGTVDVDREGVRPGPLARVSEPAAQVGAPSIDARGDDAVATWAARDARDGKWTVRWARWKHGIRVGASHALTSPTENALAPGVAMLDGGRFLLSWTEGGLKHRVRALRIGRDERPMGEVFDVSPRGVDAGQARVVIGADGHGTAAYLVAHAKAFDLVATGLTCQ
jgi:hypothetical protein